MQKEITEAIPLLDGNGNLTCAGFARKLLPVYKSPVSFKERFRTKQWDYYYVGNNHHGLCLTIDDNGYMGLDSVSFLDFDNRWEITKSPIQVMTLGKKNLPTTSERGDLRSGSSSYNITFRNDGNERRLEGFMNNFRGKETIIFEVRLTDIPEESMVIVTPFDKPGHYYYNQKINCMKASGKVTIGDQAYYFNEQDSFGTLDWGRGIWTYENTWYWSSLSTRVNGIPFGFNLGYGFGDTSAASENMLFFDGKAHKLDQVTFHIPQKDGKDDFMSSWTFTSNDYRVNLDFTPIIDRAACTNVGVILSDQHQVFGRFNGECVLDDGTIIQIEDAVGFAEKVHNKW